MQNREKSTLGRTLDTTTFFTNESIAHVLSFLDITKGKKKYLLVISHVDTAFVQESRLTLVLLNPSPNRMISAMYPESGTTIEIGRNMDFKLSGSSVRPA